MNDPSLGIIINWLEARPILPSWREVFPQSLEVKRYWRLWDLLSIQDGVVTTVGRQRTEMKVSHFGSFHGA